MSRQRVASIALAAALLIPLAASASPANAAVNVDISFGARVPFDDDNRLFVSINSRYYGRDAYFVDHWSARFRNPDDTAVFLFLVRNSSTNPQAIYDMRRRGMSWYRISQRVHVPVQSFFVRVYSDPLPPFDRAYARFSRLQRNPHYKMSLTDGDIRNLVVVRTMTDYYSIRPEIAMKLRASGRDARYLMVQEYRRRHQHDHDRAGYDRDRDRDRDYRDRDDDHGHDRDRDRHDRDDRDR